MATSFCFDAPFTGASAAALLGAGVLAETELAERLNEAARVYQAMVTADAGLPTRREYVREQGLQEWPEHGPYQWVRHRTPELVWRLAAVYEAHTGRAAGVSFRKSYRLRKDNPAQRQPGVYSGPFLTFVTEAIRRIDPDLRLGGRTVLDMLSRRKNLP